MPTKVGEFCTRCGSKCTKVLKGDKVEYHCPRQHGIQLIEDAPAPKELLPEGDAKQQTDPGETSIDPHEGLDDVGKQFTKNH